MYDFKKPPQYAVKPCLGRLLKARKITQLQLQGLSGVPQASISRFDSNQRHEATHLVAISRALGVAIEELFEISLIEPTEDDSQPHTVPPVLCTTG